MLNIEIAEALSRAGTAYEIAEKLNYKQVLSSEEKEIANICDSWVKEVATKGDPDKQLAAFIKKTVTEELYETPDELLDMLFERGSVGEFDDYYVAKNPKNTLIAHNAAKGGTVDKSWIDFSTLTPTSRNKQVETDISYVDMRKNGFKSIATLVTYATEALKNAMFHDMFSAVDAAITGGSQAIAETEATPSQASMDALSLYLTDRDPQNAVAVTLSKYAKAIMRMSGYSDYLSDAMKNDFNRYGLVKFFDGVNIASISGAKRTGQNSLLLPDKKIFGVAGKIGTLDMKGEVNVYEDFDNSNDLLTIRVKDFTYSYAITNIDNACKITMAK